VTSEVDPTNLANQPGILAQPGEPTETETARPGFGFVQRRLPWLVAIGALLLYLITLPRWVTFLGLPPMARAVGWDWRPVLHAPLQFLVTYPCRWLPAGLQVFALNLLAAICATLALALLARSVALLPHDRTRDQRQSATGEHSTLIGPIAWLPPLLAVMVCGLQMTFWENAVVWTGEALDLLLFAYVIRCLLEYRVDPRESWLWRLAFVYGLGMTNNVAMVAFLPALGMALIWIKGLSFFRFETIGVMALCALAGLSLYLLLPILQSASGRFELDFWQTLRLNLGYQKSTIFGFRRVVILILSFGSLLPVLFMGIKWPASFGDISAAGNALTNLTTHVLHGVFLLFCLSVAFDPGYSPRMIGAPFPFLTFYYLGALAIGYCSGYFLLVFGTTSRFKTWKRPTSLQKALNWAIVGLVWVSAIGAPVGLAWKNFPALKGNLGPQLSQYGGLAAKSLPREGAVVLSDSTFGQFPFQLYGLCAALKAQGTAQNYCLVETVALTTPLYHRYLHGQNPKLWPALPAKIDLTAPIDPNAQTRLLDQLGRSTPLYYLQPSFGYYFERFYLKPRRMAYELKPFSMTNLAPPSLTSEEIADNFEFWQTLAKQDLAPMLQPLKPVKGKSPRGPLVVLGNTYSRALDYLGVAIQRAGDLDRANQCFTLAQQLNPNSPSAMINLEYNRNLRAGRPEPIKPTDEMERRMARFGGNWDGLLAWNGPLDEPGLDNDLALALANGRNYRQAALELQRIAFLTPTNMDARVGLADLCLKAGLIDMTLQQVAEVRATGQRLHTSERETLMQAEAWAYLYRNDLPSAERVLREGQQQYPLNDAAYFTLAEIYSRIGRITNAMEVLEKQLKSQPENGGAMNNLARLKIINQDYEAAITLLDHAIKLDPKNSLLILNRAISNLKTGKLDDAQRDYQTLESVLPKVPYTIHFGLFDAAYRKKNPKTALKYGELYLKAAPRGTTEYKDVQERTKKAKSGDL